jgi:hypothetical protein
VVLADPCPAVDKVSELKKVEVFDGDDFASTTILGSTLAVCCGPGQTTVGSAAPGAPCTTSTQDVMGEMGIVTQGVTP